MGRLWLILVAIAGVSALTGCSTFHREWKQAMKSGLPRDDISGPWEGEWRSTKNGHTGRLRCVLIKQNEHQYDAHFRARFWKVFSASYTVPFVVQRTETNFTFYGTADLGKLSGGLFRYSGKATPRDFYSSYESKHDHGMFEMERP